MLGGPHISRDDLLESMRLNGNVEEVSQVKSAYKERSGRISIMRRPAPPRVWKSASKAGCRRCASSAAGCEARPAHPRAVIAACDLRC